MKKLVFAILVLFSSYAIGQVEKATPPKIGIKIPLGKTLEYKEVAIKFLEVIEDSRCPKNVSCIWAGRAIVRAAVTTEGKTEEKTMIFGELRQGEEENHLLYASDEFSLSGLTLNPYPTSERTEETTYSLVVSEQNDL